MKAVTPSVVKNMVQPKRNQAYYDNIAKQLSPGMYSYNPKTGNTTYATNTGTTVLKGMWDNTRMWFAKQNLRSKANPNPNFLDAVGKKNVVSHVNNTDNIMSKSNFWVKAKS